ncbi:hypothetical protein [Planobispora longispora]|uniref:Guanylate cyclase domain-containing protein n=1 Tax=Planobispora longispora TaxID=28887 RepID=A0A8J3W5I0_9ACTN|nr:hypothetical protein [Planobispora longispora]GIH76503.1 hypothetical protein Plo01_29320 [Planobispora longispora]
MEHRTEHRIMIAADIEDYSSRNRDSQATLQRDLVRALDHAATLAQLGTLDWRRQEQGDGQFVVLPPGTGAVTVLTSFVTELNEVLAGYNSATSRMRMRLSVHEGPVVVDGANGFPGAHAVQVNRLVNAAALKAAMRARPEADLGVIISDRTFEDYVGQSRGGPSKDDFRRVKVAEKKERYIAHIHLPGHNVHALGALPGSAEPAGPGSPRAAEDAGAPAGHVFRLTGKGANANVSGRDQTINQRYS